MHTVVLLQAELVLPVSGIMVQVEQLSVDFHLVGVGVARVVRHLVVLEVIHEFQVFVLPHVRMVPDHRLPIERKAEA